MLTNSIIHYIIQINGTGTIYKDVGNLRYIFLKIYGTGTTSKCDKYQKGDLRMYTGNYECLELFVKPDEGKKGSVL